MSRMADKTVCGTLPSFLTVYCFFRMIFIEFSGVFNESTLLSGACNNESM